jgi:hypothetical protein
MEIAMIDHNMELRLAPLGHPTLMGPAGNLVTL